jgi:hypothetical protein
MGMHCIYVRVQSMWNLHKMNTSYSERFLDGPVGVHYREVLLYFIRILFVYCVTTCTSIYIHQFIQFSKDSMTYSLTFLVWKCNYKDRVFCHLNVSSNAKEVDICQRSTCLHNIPVISLSNFKKKRYRENMKHES